MATYWENSCSFGLRYVSWCGCLIVGLVFSHLGFWSGNLFLIAPFPDLCLLVPFFEQGIKFIEHIYDFRIKQFYTIEQLQNFYNIPQNDYLKYHNIVSNIKSEWKTRLKNDECNLLPQIQNKVLQIIKD